MRLTEPHDDVTPDFQLFSAALFIHLDCVQWWEIVQFMVRHRCLFVNRLKRPPQRPPQRPLGGRECEPFHSSEVKNELFELIEIAHPRREGFGARDTRSREPDNAAMRRKLVCSPTPRREVPSSVWSMGMGACEEWRTVTMAATTFDVKVGCRVCCFEVSMQTGNSEEQGAPIYLFGTVVPPSSLPSSSSSWLLLSLSFVCVVVVAVFRRK